MPKVTTNSKITLKNLNDYLNASDGVPIPRMGNLKGITRTALARVFEMHLNQEIKFKIDSQKRIRAYSKDYIPKVGRPSKQEKVKPLKEKAPIVATVESVETNQPETVD